MSDPEHRTDAEPAQSPLDANVPRDDPYPRMILVCFAIFFVLLFVIFGVIAYDLTQRADQRVLPGTPREEAPPPPPPS